MILAPVVKRFMLVNYDSRVVLTRKLPIFIVVI